MTRMHIPWLMVALAIVPLMSDGCGGDDSAPGAATGTAGTGGSTTGTGGTGGSTTGTGGAAGTGGASGGGAGGTSGSGGTSSDSGLVDGRVPCGGVNGGCNPNPSSNNICDAPNSRCVDCMTDADCAVEPPNVHCDTRPNAAGLPTYACRECLDNSHCMGGATCVSGECVTQCGTAMCETNEVCDMPNNRCVDCLSDTDCADETTDKRCDLRPNMAGLPTGSCEECLESGHCPTGELCVDDNCQPSCTTDANCSADGGGNSPYCHPTVRICTECATDMHCATNTNNPHCTPTGDCEECLSDANCTNPMQPFCDDNECVTCRTSADCVPPQTCNNQGNCTTPSDGGGRG
jgi:Cys-rich repeat protein